MDRFISTLRGVLEAGQDIDNPLTRARLVYEMIVAKKGSSNAPSICYTDGVKGYRETDLLIRNYFGPSMYDCPGEESILLFNRDLCQEEPDLADSYISNILHPADPNGVARRTFLIRSYTPSAGMRLLIRHRPLFLVWDFIDESMLKQLQLSIRTAIARPWGRLKHILFIVKEDQLATASAKIASIMNMAYFSNEIKVSWQEIVDTAEKIRGEIANGQILPLQLSVPSAGSSNNEKITDISPGSIISYDKSTQTPHPGAQSNSLAECPICFELGADVVIVPCMHLFFCRRCGDEIKNADCCPFCRHPVEDVLRTYKVSAEPLHT